MTDTKELFRPLASLEAPDVWDRVGAPSQHHASTPRHRKVFALLAAALVTSLIVALMVAAFAPGDSGGPATTPSIPPDLHGQALIDALALPVIDQHDTDCKFIFDFEGTYYCLDAAAETEVQANDLWNQIIDSSSQATAIAVAKDNLARASEAVQEATRSGDQAAIDEASAAYSAALEAIHELLRADAPAVDNTASVQEQIAALDRRSAEMQLELEDARHADQSQVEEEAQIEMIENEITIIEDAIGTLCDELRANGQALPPAC